MSGPVVEVRDLSVRYATGVQAVAGASFALGAGEAVALVGDSGSGKSTIAVALLALSQYRGAQAGGSVRLEGRELLGLSERELQSVRGAAIALVPQDPLSALNPVMRVGTQMIEQIRAHESLSKREARERAGDLLEHVELPLARDRLAAYPFELSGGMRQRVAIAMALSCSPRALVADEPTSSLDMTVQAQILQLLRGVRDAGVALLVITHDRGVVGEVADRVLAMEDGRVREETAPAEATT